MKKGGKFGILGLGIVLSLFFGIFFISLGEFASAVSCEDCMYTDDGWTDVITAGPDSGGIQCNAQECQDASSQVADGCIFYPFNEAQAYTWHWEEYTYSRVFIRDQPNGAPEIRGVCSSPWWNGPGELKVSDNYKINHGLSTGWWADSYEYQGVGELLAPGKLIDVSAADKAEIAGVITEYDNLQVNFYFWPFSYDAPYLGIPWNYDVDVELFEGTYANPVSLGVSQSVAASACSSGSCSAIFNNPPINRGKLIFAKLTAKQNGQVIGSVKTKYLAVAGYNYFTFPTNQPTDWMKIQYGNFSELSDLNKKLIYTGKPVYMNYNPSLPTSPSNCVPFYNNLLSSGVLPGFDNNADAVLIYNSAFLPIFGLHSGIGALTHCPPQLIAPTSNIYLLGIATALGAVFDYDTSVLNAKIIFLKDTSPGYSQNKYILAHEMGHFYGNHLEEYGWAEYYTQINGGSVGFGGFSGTGPATNAKNEFNQIDFPICCQKWVCCATPTTGLILGTTPIHNWKEAFKCPAPSSILSAALAISPYPVSDSDCASSGPKPKGYTTGNINYCIKPYYSMINNAEAFNNCGGTPYYDADGLQPNAELTTSELSNSYYYSIMGSPNFDVKRTYPENSVCPLKCP